MLKCCIVGKFSVEESAISLKRGLNDDFVEQFSALNIELMAGFMLMGQVPAAPLDMPLLRLPKTLLQRHFFGVADLKS